MKRNLKGGKKPRIKSVWEKCRKRYSYKHAYANVYMLMQTLTRTQSKSQKPSQMHLVTNHPH